MQLYNNFVSSSGSNRINLKLNTNEIAIYNFYGNKHGHSERENVLNMANFELVFLLSN